ncbi:MAG TPA: protease complex subunit PrcB family protein [Candidatus Contendobacter sp.]|nr:protease complex subunit PrcB family protein [Candidatus Contendobacter sp.]
MRSLVWTTLAMLALASGCAQDGAGRPGDRSLLVKALYGSGQCGGLERPAVVWIADPEAWRRWYGRVVSLRMTPPPPPPVDFPREGVLLVAMGQRPSSGYGLSLAGESTAVRDGVLTVRVDWREPPPGYRQAQVMTSPCLLALLSAASFTRMQILDQEGRVRLEGVRSPAE